MNIVLTRSLSHITKLVGIDNDVRHVNFLKKMEK